MSRKRAASNPRCLRDEANADNRGAPAPCLPSRPNAPTGLKDRDVDFTFLDGTQPRQHEDTPAIVPAMSREDTVLKQLASQRHNPPVVKVGLCDNDHIVGRREAVQRLDLPPTKTEIPCEPCEQPSRVPSNPPQLWLDEAMSTHIKPQCARS